MTVQVHCQHCGHDFEAEVDGKTTICPACEKETPINAPPQKPKITIEAPPTPVPSPPVPLKDSMLIRHKAEVIEIVSFWFMGLGIIGLLFSFLAIASANTENDARGAFIGCIVCASLLTIGIWAYLIAQIIHIRANTQKD